MTLKCPNCNFTFGKEITPILTTLTCTTRQIPILGIQAKLPSGILWELDYTHETEEDGDILEQDYECSYCGAVLSEDYIALLFEEGSEK